MQNVLCRRMPTDILKISIEERNIFEDYDKVCQYLIVLFQFTSHATQKFGIRSSFVEKLKEEFSDCGLVFSIGGQISFDVVSETVISPMFLIYLVPPGYDNLISRILLTCD